ncbi:MAG: L-threonylcarbamoyladenylate synthase [Bacillota bacterium]
MPQVISKKVKGTLLLGDDYRSLQAATKIINHGGLVAFPTETVYGLGASALDSRAISLIYAAKGRPQDNPLIVHVGKHDQLSEVAANVPEAAYRLIEEFWPGPLSLVLPRAERIPKEVSAGLSTVAVRMPDHKIAIDLINLAGVPIAAPSANRSGRPSPTSYRHVLEDLVGCIDAVIRSEDCPVGVESTVLDLTGNSPVILRPGGISLEDIEEILKKPIYVSGNKESSESPSSPGMKYRHYSPQAPLILVTGREERRRRVINSLCAFYRGRGFKVGFLNSFIEKDLSKSIGPDVLAAKLYRILREMDSRNMDLILAEEIPEKGLGLAVMNRLKKAATRILRA